MKMIRFSLCLSTVLLYQLAPQAQAQSGSGGGSGGGYQAAAPQYGSGSGAQPTGSGAAGSGYSGSSGAVPAGSGAGSAGSGAGGSGGDARAMAGNELAMRGFCPVCLVENKQWVAGDPRFTAPYDGKNYRFPDAQRMQAFLANPARYAPALGGDNVVKFVKTGARVPGDLAFGVNHGGRTFFVGSQAERDEFLSNPALFSAADVALGGNCVVCRVDMNQQIPGSPQLTTTRGGIQYRFAGVDQKNRFMAAPERYTAAAPPAAGSGARPAGSGGSGSGANPGSTAKPQGSGGSGGFGSGGF